MAIRVKNELIPLNLLVIVLVAIIILFLSDVSPVILGLPLLLFFPGYMLAATPITEERWKSWDRALSVVLALFILGALGMLGYAIANPKVGERFTEFYIEGLEGKAADYPKELVMGEEGKVIVGIINREHETVTYRVEVTIDGDKSNEVGPVALDHDEKWEEIVGFTPNKAGDNQKVEFLLYGHGQNEVYQRLHLWVDVR